MKIAALHVVGNLASIFCVALAGYMAVNAIDGWGWFLTVAVLLSVSVSSKKGDEA